MYFKVDKIVCHRCSICNIRCLDYLKNKVYCCRVENSDFMSAVLVNIFASKNTKFFSESIEITVHKYIY